MGRQKIYAKDLGKAAKDLEKAVSTAIAGIKEIAKEQGVSEAEVSKAFVASLVYCIDKGKARGRK